MVGVRGPGVLLMCRALKVLGLRVWGVIRA